MLTKAEMLELLKADVVPALGCTEPVCVALCAAHAASALGAEPERIEVSVNAGIYKNGMSAGIPNSDRVGLPTAAALGALLKNADKQLRLLEDIDERIRREANALSDGGMVKVSVDPAESGLYVRVTVYAGPDSATAVIRGAHTSLVYLAQGETVLLQKDAALQKRENRLVDELLAMRFSEIRALVETASGEELAFLYDGVEMNERLAAYSETVPTGVGLAENLRREIGGQLLADDLMSRILLQVTSAAESRLDGCPFPTMSSSGAGTKGLVVILPISETAKAIQASRERELRALAFGHLINRYINAKVGKLSAMCSCVMAASTAACAGIAYLLGAADGQIGSAVRNMTGTVTGMICDGGKVGCALKVSAGSAAALLCALQAVRGGALRVSDGICAETPEDCVANMARIGDPGMRQADREILDIMLNKAGGSAP